MTKKVIKKKVVARKPVEEKVVAEKVITGKTLTVKLVKSPIGVNPKQRATIKGLGLTRMNKRVTLVDNPCVRGMINKVIHMLEVTL